jgi:TRAP-type C4-dicarboxylate transport system substrate-binding protein
MKFKSALPSLVAGAAALSVALGATAPAAADTFRLRVGAGHPVQGIAHVTAVDTFFIPEVTKRAAAAGHTVEWTKAWGGSIAKLSEVLEATKNGLLDVGVVNFPFHPSLLGTHNFPFFMFFQPGDVILTVKAVRQTYDEVPWMYELFEKRYNQKHIGVGQNGDYGIGTTFPFTKFEDLKGKKIGAAGPNLRLFSGQDVAGVQTNLNESYNAMQSGVYQGMVIFPGPYFGFKLHEVGKYYLNAHIGTPAAIALTVNTNVWNKLPPEMQKILTEVGREYDIENSKLQGQADADAIGKLRAAGVTVSELPFAEQKKWAETLAHIPNEMAQEANKRGDPGTAVFSTYIKIVKDLGYTWPVEYKIQ